MIKYGKYSHVKNNSITILTCGAENVNVVVGNFTSISSNCTILLSHGHHRYETGTVFAFHLACSHHFDNATHIDPVKAGNVVIGNDVWIGHNVTIMPGVVIGDGAVIATGSCVVTDIEPYSIYGGNPAKLIKHRFSKEIIDKFLDLKWWNLDDKVIDVILPLLEQVPTLATLDEIQHIIQNIQIKDTQDNIDTRKTEIFCAYQELLHRLPDRDGYHYYYNSDLSISEIKHSLQNSDEYKNLLINSKC